MTAAKHAEYANLLKESMVWHYSARLLCHLMRGLTLDEASQLLMPNLIRYLEAPRAPLPPEVAAPATRPCVARRYATCCGPFFFFCVVCVVPRS